MTEPGDGRVAVYIDFDNIVISRYDQVHGRGSFMRDRQRSAGGQPKPTFAARLAEARVDLGAVIDFSSSFGTLVLTRAYADWSAAVNAEYRGQLVGRAVDLVQLFPAAAYAKNGADIRLAVDAVEDLFRLPELTHVVIVAGDSDYVPLAQRIKRLGRYVVGIGVAGSTARSLAAACDEFVSYDDLPGIARDEAADAADDVPVAAASAGSAATSSDQEAAVTPAEDEAPAAAATTTSTRSRKVRAEQPAAAADDEENTAEDAEEAAAEEPEQKPKRRRRRPAETAEQPDEEPAEDLQLVATRLLARAMQLGHEKDDSEWLHAGQVKSQMKRMDPSFSEKALGYRSFSDFVKSRDSLVELDDSSTAQLIRLAPSRPRRARHSGRISDPVNAS
ncbi:NYN domain-containing protein [Leifsonia sp. F6_8S_P_1B]|uniref:NYN domain-containing protein n=1 Tax=Leifsonia williamsii TaxID=3035919 RepID=A0ABT8KG65_9MICO|nr:NYN domain-containing protein [Leifsonia williamsii]MDN4615766.1 NYN domain-containing protein [Leifsonia williamsii]